MERISQMKHSSTAPTNDGTTVGYEAQLWQMADALCHNMGTAEYKHIILSLSFLKYISDAFEATDGGVIAGFGGDK
jgi:type I restriction enzyme M protein